MAAEHEEELEHILMGTENNNTENEDIIQDEPLPGEELEERKVEVKPGEETKVEVKAVVRDTVSPRQKEIMTEIVKLDLEIENLSSSTVDEKEFYKNLNDHLSEEEQYLEEDDKAAYLELVEQKRKDYVEKNSNSEEIQKKQDEKQKLELEDAAEIGLREVTDKYPEYNHVEMAKFSKSKLNEEEKEGIEAKAKSFGEIFTLTYELYLQKNNIKNPKVKQESIPNTVQTKDLSKEVIEDDDLSNLNVDNSRFNDALGL